MMEKDANSRKKYILEKHMSIQLCGHTLYRIRALTAFGFHGFTWPAVHIGDLGGYVESEANLSQDGPCWVADDARVLEGAYICGGAVVSDKAIVHGESVVKDIARVHGNAGIAGRAVIAEAAEVYGHASVQDLAIVRGRSRVCGEAHITGTAMIEENVVVDSDHDH